MPKLELLITWTPKFEVRLPDTDIVQDVSLRLAGPTKEPFTLVGRLLIKEEQVRSLFYSKTEEQVEQEACYLLDDLQEAAHRMLTNGEEQNTFPALVLQALRQGTIVLNLHTDPVK